MFVSIEFFSNVLLTTILVYLFVNSLSHFLVAMNRSFFIFFGLFFIFLLLMMHSVYSMFDLYLFIGIVLISALYFGYENLKQRHGYVLFHVRKQEYDIVFQFIDNYLKEQGYPSSSVCYTNKKPFLLVFRGQTKKQIKPIIKNLEKELTPILKNYRLIHFIYFVAMLITILVIWRF